MSRVILFLAVVATAFSFSGCLEDRCAATHQYQVWEPFYVNMDEQRHTISAESARTLGKTGNLYVYGQYIFINEYREGIHIVDNSDPEQPTPIAFLEIPGNVNLAVRNNLLYADSYVDLVVLDISDPLNVRFAGRTENVFPSHAVDDNLGHLMFYEPTDQMIEVDCSEPYRRSFWLRNGGGIAIDVFVTQDAAVNEAVGGSSSVGIAGSLARFSIVGQYLYSVSEYDLQVFDLGDPLNAQLASTVNIGWGIETIFPYGDHLFIGADHGMYIFNNSDPLHPTQVSLFEHARACDPVFVSGDKAYVTLRDGTECEGFNNQLDVVDISNLSAPRLLATHPMDNPHGLSLASDELYLCEGKYGFKIFDAADWREIGQRQLAHFKGFSAYDVITLPGQNLALVIGEDGLYQFDISDPAQPRQLSILHTGRE